MTPMLNFILMFGGLIVAVGFLMAETTEGPTTTYILVACFLVTVTGVVFEFRDHSTAAANCGPTKS